jgi:hypothetical protein
MVSSIQQERQPFLVSQLATLYGPFHCGSELGLPFSFGDRRLTQSPDVQMRLAELDPLFIISKISVSKTSSFTLEGMSGTLDIKDEIFGASEIACI